MSKFLLFVLSAFLFAISLLNITITDHYRLWQLSVVTKEYGHLFAIFTALMLIFFFRRRVTQVLAVGALLCFIYPVVSAKREEEAWRLNLPKTLQKTAPLGPLFEIQKLFWNNESPKVDYTRIVLAKVGVSELHIDFYPAQNRTGKAPWVFVIHGGGWETGNSQQLPELNWHLAKNGYAVAAINYRLLPTYKWPAQKEDAMAALQYLKDHAVELNLDPNNYFILGRSAGAQIGGVVAFNLDDPGLRGLIALYPPTDLTFGYEVGAEDDVLESRSLLRNLFGGTPYEQPELYDDGSVVLAADRHPKPTLLLHGFPDRLTWFKHSERLALRLEAKKIPYGLVVFPWATHGFDWNPNGPAAQISRHAIDYFLKEFTQNPAAAPAATPGEGPSAAPKK